MKIILASQSPRRKELLGNIIKNFDVVASNFDEKTIIENNNIELVKKLSYYKAKKVFNKFDGDRCVIGSDTIVCLDNKVFGKPKNAEDAKNMLRQLSGKMHFVITGLAVIFSRESKEFKKITYTKNKVFFTAISDNEIDEYISTFEPMDKAGAYAIQGFASKFIEKIEGDYSSIVGLPVNKLYRILKKSNII